MKNHEHQSSPSADAASVIRDLAHAFNRWMAIDVESHKYASAGQYTHEQLRTLMYLAFQAGVKLAAPGSAIPPPKEKHEVLSVSPERASVHSESASLWPKPCPACGAPTYEDKRHQRDDSPPPYCALCGSGAVTRKAGSAIPPLTRERAMLLAHAVLLCDTTDQAADVLMKWGSAIPPEGWQPIKTAPRDGTEMLLLESGRRDVGRWFECGPNEQGFFAVHAIRWHPTHWMPLPDPPLAGDATGDERRTQKKKTDARVDGRG